MYIDLSRIAASKAAADNVTRSQIEYLIQTY